MGSEDVRRHVFSTFSGVASSLGFSEVHGMIIGSLVTESGPLPLQEIAKRTGYSLSSISISIDFLELVGVVRKIKNLGDRKVYVQLEGDLIESVRQAFMIKLQKEIMRTNTQLEKHRQNVKDAQTRKAVDTLQREVTRLQKYIDDLSKVEIPK